MLVYVDQNFLSTCAITPKWIDVIVEARAAGSVTIVLSITHFYEIAKSKVELREDILALIAQIQPSWALERADLQLREFVNAWDLFWAGEPYEFAAIGTLDQASATLHGVSQHHHPEVTVQEHVKVFTQRQAVIEYEASFDQLQGAANLNRIAHKNGTMGTYSSRTALDMKFAAVMCARVEKDGEPEEVYKLSSEILQRQPLATQIEVFVYWGLMKSLRCYQVEGAMTTQLYNTSAILDRNRSIDRQHAVIALAFCDVFVTDDKDLIRRCEAAKLQLPFKTAKVQTGKDFICSLAR